MKFPDISITLNTNRIRVPAVTKYFGYLLGLMLLIAILSPVLSNDKPLFVSSNGQWFFPILTGKNFIEITDAVSGKTKKIIIEDIRFPQPEYFSINPLFPYAPYKSDLINSGYTTPFENQFAMRDGKKIKLEGINRHLLGTGKRGEDVLSGLIHGAKVSLTVGIISMLIAGIIGITLGAMAGYFGDQSLTTSRGNYVTTLLGILPAWFYSFPFRRFTIADAYSSSAIYGFLQLLISVLLFILILYLFYRAGFLLKKYTWFAAKIPVRIDSLITRLIEIIISLPRIILIVTIAAIAKPSLISLIIIIGLTSWTEIARLTRAEMLRVRSLGYIESARALGLRDKLILFRHALPNTISPALVAFSFGVASAILAESSLSFLGIGVPYDQVTWGSMLASGRENFSAWWLVTFPGLAIFITVAAFNLWGELLRDLLDPKSKIRTHSH
jgi:peptide/nickel transport system permease protein